MGFHTISICSCGIPKLRTTAPRFQDSFLKWCSHRGHNPRQVMYGRLIGKLHYLSQCTRPDITYAVRELSCYSSNPGEQHWKSAMHLLRYLKHTKYYAIYYGNVDDPYPLFQSFTEFDIWDGIRIQNRHSSYIILHYEFHYHLSLIILHNLALSGCAVLSEESSSIRSSTRNNWSSKTASRVIVRRNLYL
jgi:hypothetical protein